MGFIIRFLLFVLSINGDIAFESCCPKQFHTQNDEISSNRLAECKHQAVLTSWGKDVFICVDRCTPHHLDYILFLQNQFLGIKDNYPSHTYWVLLIELLRTLHSRFKSLTKRERRHKNLVEFQNVQVSELLRSSSLEKRLYILFRKSFSKELSLDDFRKLFKSRTNLEFSFMVKGGKDIGIMFFMTVYDKDTDILFLRPGVGIIPEERGQKFPRNLILKKMFLTKLRRPFKQVVLLSVSMSPIAYMQGCTYFKHTYPNPRYEPSQKMLAIKQRCCELFQLNEVRNDVIKIHFKFDSPNKSDKYHKPNFFIYHYRHLIKSSEKDLGLLTIIPVSLINLAGAMIKILMSSI